MSFIRISICLFSLAAWSVPAAQGTLIVQGYNTNFHDRFTNHADFIGNPYNWSGVGRGTQWATMVSDSFFVSASHAHPGLNADVTFYHGNDPGGMSESHTVAQGWRIDGSDLWLGRLSSSVSSNVEKYAIADVTPSGAEGLTFSTFGRTGGAATPTSQRMGRNVVTQSITNFSDPALSGSGDVFIFDYDVPGLGADEARVTGGDSGAPTFVLTPSGPAVLGIHWFMYQNEMLGELGSGDTFVPSYIDDMNLIMAGFGESLSVVAVPEPSSVVLLFSIAAGIALYRRRLR
ncbi:MAG: PEP-CTERM sorting domain-containing protein [Planctomycetaceae bacterium]